MMCVCCRGEGRVDLFLGHRLCRQKINTERTSFSQGHTVGGGRGGPRSPSFAAEIHSGGNGGGCWKAPQEFPVGFLLRGSKMGQGEVGGLLQCPGRVPSQSFFMPRGGVAKRKEMGALLQFSMSQAPF